MDSDEFRAILTRGEDETLDFKRDFYKVCDADSKTRKDEQAAFAKDLLCLWNTPRNDSAYIVIGVKANVGKPHDVLGLHNHIDSADLQQMLDRWIDPAPAFEYLTVDYEGKCCAVIKIPVRKEIGISFPIRDHGDKLRKHQIYFRKNSRNSPADPADQKRIRDWFDDLELGEIQRRTGLGEWHSIRSAVRDFPRNYRHVLTLSRLSVQDPSLLKSVSSVDWDLVIDFDSRSLTDGVLSYCRNDIQAKRALHIAVGNEAPEFRPGYSTYWYMARGIDGRQATLVTDKLRDWITSCRSGFSRTIQRMAGAISPAPVTMIALWDENHVDTEYLKTTIDEVLASFGSGLDIVVVTPAESSPLNKLEEHYDARIFICPIDHVLHGFKSLPISGPGIQSDRRVTFPMHSGAPREIESEKQVWLREEMDLLCLEAGLDDVSDIDYVEEFLRGKEIDWVGLNLRADIERDLQAQLLRAVSDALSKRRALRVNLFHKPGAGGTTLARRIAWELHKEYPALLLEKCVPNETAERLSYMLSVTGNAILLVVDGGVISDEESDALFSRLRADHTPVVMLQVRRHQGEFKPGSSRFYLDEQLTSQEMGRMMSALTRMRPGSKERLREFSASTDTVYQTPFFLSLVTFEHEFAGFDRYVDVRLEHLSLPQVRVVLFICMAHWYGQQSVEADAFRHILGLPEGRPVRLRQIMPGLTMDLLVTDKFGRWRTVHPLIAERAIKKLLSGESPDLRVWDQQLSKHAIEFIEFCRGDGPYPTEEGLDLVYRVVISREDMGFGDESSSGNKSSSSRLLEDVPSAQGRLEVLRKLTVEFSDQAHFWAHMGRYLSNAMGQYDAALDALDTALTLNDGSSVIHHMRGMVLRNTAYSLIRDHGSEEKIIEFASRAAISFGEARRLAPHDDHGYISHVQMMIKIIDHIARERRVDPMVAIASSQSAWLRDSLAVCEDLLESVRRNHQGEAPSPLEEKCRADLSAVYGDHAEALQRWDNLLHKDSVYVPSVRRQIVWTYLARHDRCWNKVPQKEVRRIVSLLEQNLETGGRVAGDYRHWMQAVRQLSVPPSLDSIIEKVAYWKLNTDSVDATYYLYVLHAIQAMGGSPVSRGDALRFSEECRQRTQYWRNRSRSFEWLGAGEGIKALVHHDQLGSWDRNRDFFSDARPFRRVAGIISKISGPQAGEIEVEGGLPAFFVPGKSGHHRGSSENQPVTFYLGFAYDGLRAWSVGDTQERED